MSCARCESYFGDWRSHGPTFPETDWLVVERRDWPIEGPGGMTGFDGVAQCRGCGQHADFSCTIPAGFAFSRR
jgi:hypothetical protein